MSVGDILQIQRHTQVKHKGWKYIYYGNSNQNRAEVAILITDKISLKTRIVTRMKAG